MENKKENTIMEKTKKVTKAMVLSTIEGYFAEEDRDAVLATVDGLEITAGDIIDYAVKTQDQIAAKAEKAKAYVAKKKAESDELKEAVASVLTDEFQTREDILAALDANEEITIAKVGARLTALVKAGRAVEEEIKTVTGKKMGYKLA